MREIRDISCSYREEFFNDVSCLVAGLKLIQLIHYLLWSQEVYVFKKKLKQTTSFIFEVIIENICSPSLTPKLCITCSI